MRQISYIKNVIKIYLDSKGCQNELASFFYYGRIRIWFTVYFRYKYLCSFEQVKNAIEHVITDNQSAGT